MVHLTHSGGLPQDELLVPSTYGDLDWAGIGPVLGQDVGANIQTGPTLKLSVLWRNAPTLLVHGTHSDGLPQDYPLVKSTHGHLDWVGIGPSLGQVVGANIQTGPTCKLSVLRWNAPTVLVHWTYSDGLPQDDLLVPSTYGDLDWVCIGPVLGQTVGANIQTDPTSKISVLWWNAPFVGPFDPFRRPAPGQTPGSKHLWELRLGWYRSRPGASRRREYPNGSNIKNISFMTKCANFDGPFDPFRRPDPGRPPGSRHLWAFRFGWYMSRPGARRRGEYPNGSNIKNISFMTKCANFDGPFDPFRRPAPGRPPGSRHLWAFRFGWYMSRPGARRRGEYPNGSNIKNISFMTKCANFDGPFDPFRRPAPGRPPGSRHLWAFRFGWYMSRPGARRRGEYPNGSNIKNISFMTKCANFDGPFDPFRRPAPGRPPGS